MHAKRLFTFIAVGTVLLMICAACGLGGESEPATSVPAAAGVAGATVEKTVENSTRSLAPTNTQPPAAPATQPPAATGTGTLRLDKTTFDPGEEIQVHFTTSTTLPDSAWVGIIPADVPHGSEATNDEYDLDYQYLDGQASGIMTFTAPPDPGSYDFRMHDADSSGLEVASVTFQVEGD